MKSSVKDESLVDLTETLRSYKIRSEIERAFFFHLFYEILRQQFGLEVKGKEKDIFDRKANQVSLQGVYKLIGRDIKSVIEARENYERASEEDRQKWIKAREERIVYHSKKSKRAKSMAIIEKSPDHSYER